MITLCDTGPLVAYLNRNNLYHAWVVALMRQVRPPMSAGRTLPRYMQGEFEAYLKCGLLEPRAD